MIERVPFAAAIRAPILKRPYGLHPIADAEITLLSTPSRVLADAHNPRLTTCRQASPHIACSWRLSITVPQM
jgi:hypothetical protein